MASKESVVASLARSVAEEVGVLPELAYADMLYNPTYYYKDYTKSGGKLSPKEWVLLCEKERAPVKNRKSLR